ncbi:MAG: sigma-70 family RNA polymerase sigma factor [Actinomycetota bacterium]|nr:sigma-70 family RNA polymerase sigma factor [Actinomycetota bacterium]
MSRDFAREWPALQSRLFRFLGAKRVPAAERDDLIQEVAARLVTLWPKVDRDRSAWPLTVTIALNLLRDRARRRPVTEVYGDVPDLAHPSDVEIAGIARLELEEVLRAVRELSPSHRDALLSELAGVPEVPATPAQKMIRVRARRKLASALGRLSGAVVLRWRRADPLHALLPGSDTAMQAVACLACLLVGTGATLSLYPPPDRASPSARSFSGVTTLSLLDPTVGSESIGDPAVLAPKPGVTTAGSSDTQERRGRARAPESADTESASSDDSTTSLPGTDDSPVAPPQADSVDEPPAPGEVDPPAPPEPDDVPAKPPVDVPPAVEEVVDSVKI